MAPPRPDAVNLSRLGQIGIIVQDLPAAVAFYRDTLGLPFLFESGGMAFFDLGDIRLMLGTSDRQEQQHRASILYYRVDDIDEAYDALRSRGVAFEAPPLLAHTSGDQELWLAFFRDMENNILALMSEVAAEE